MKDTNRTGDISELKAVVWLLEQGYEVFRNVGCTGPIDIVAIKDGITTLIDVKTLKFGRSGFCFRHKKMDKQIAQGIKTLWVYKDTVGWNRDYF